VLVLEGTKSAWVYDPQQSPRELLRVAVREAQVRSLGAASVLSLATVSTEASAVVADVPRPRLGPKVRPPAVAGSFYPGEVEVLWKTIDSLLGEAGPQREFWPAVLVPHAGLQYSGKVAAAVYRSIEIPDVVIVLGPRHTRVGVEWAVAPHEVWSLPGATIASDPALARQLAAAIPDLHLDALAHEREHCIEVQLPFLARLAPQTRVVGITLGAGTLDRCRQFASGLAGVLRQQADKPLLVISSDLNHYSSDSENRRLDALALAALERLDPAEVYGTIVQGKISMCGLLPAVIVLETLRQLGMLRKCQRVAYATSAEVTGDSRRVVGYAGMLFG
jgi:AmmeMemoRadiSam system protein B